MNAMKTHNAKIGIPEVVLYPFWLPAKARPAAIKTVMVVPINPRLVSAFIIFSCYYCDKGDSHFFPLSFAIGMLYKSDCHLY
jgi:hypothetical protein